MNDFHPSQVNNILIIQLGDIGDVVLTTPSIHALKTAYPSAFISVLLNKPFGSLLQSDPQILNVVEVSKIRGLSFSKVYEHIHFLLSLHHADYDLVIDLRTGDRGALYSFFTGAKTRIARSIKKPFWHDLLFTNVYQDPPYSSFPTHPGADQSLRLLRAFGIHGGEDIPKLFFSPQDKQHALNLLAQCALSQHSKWVSINPCSRWKYKEWNYKHWRVIIDLLWHNHQIKSVLIGAEDEAVAAAEIISDCTDYAFNLAGKTSLGELSALISMSTLHLGVDSSAPHIAMAVGKPSITIFGPGNWRSWTMPDELHRVVTSNMPCQPCNKMGCNDLGVSLCLSELSPMKVYAEVDAILAILSNKPETRE
jgi:heptosyltransferase-3